MNPMSDALKARRMSSANPNDMQASAPAPAGQHGKDPMQVLLASLDQDSKVKLKQALDAELEPNDNDDESQPDDLNGQAKTSPDEIKDANASLNPHDIAAAQGAFKGTELGSPDHHTVPPNGLGSKLKSSFSKHFKK